MPVDQAIKEGEIMAAAAQQDAQALAAVGVDFARIQELMDAVGVLRLAQAKLTAAIGELKEAGRQWAAEEPGAYELRSELLAALTYALRNVPDAVKALRKIREGTGNPDMIQDLMALAQLGKKYLQQLLAIKFDANLLDATAKKADDLGKLYAKAFIEKGTVSSREVRDRAFTYMRMVMGEILDAAEYAFRKNKDRLEYYYSSFRSRRAGKQTEAEPEQAEVEGVTA
jgi:hypothetical protein